MSNLMFAEEAWEQYIYWQTYDKKTLHKINTLLKELQRDPFHGTGKPELLKGTASWSRRINDTDRLVYEVSDGVVMILQCKGHYNDK